MRVNCVFRVHTRGEILKSVFDTEEGRVVALPQLFKLDVKQFYFYEENYLGGPFITAPDLEYMLLNHESAIAAINYNNVGAIIVTYSKSFTVPLGNAGFKDGPIIPLLEEVNRETEIIGVVKTCVNTLRVTTPQALLIVDTTEGWKIVHTRFGPMRIGFKYEPLSLSQKIDMTRHVELCKNDSAYGTCIVGGQVRFVGLQQGKLVLLEE